MNSFKLGFESEWQLREVDGSTNRSNSGVMLTRAKYARDDIKDSHALDVSAAYTDFFAGAGAPFRPNTAFGPESLTAIYSPLAGVEYAHIFDAYLIAFMPTLAAVAAPDARPPNPGSLQCPQLSAAELDQAFLPVWLG